MFEGWTTKVEEEKAGGAQLLLSELAIQREQADGSAVFFNPNSAQTLGNCMESFPAIDADIRVVGRAAATGQAPARSCKFTGDFVHVVRSAGYRR